MRRLISVGVLVVLASGCAIAMAASGRKPAEIAQALRPGTPRDAVVTALGAPSQSRQSEQGQRVETFAVTATDAPSTGRASMHGVLDLWTMGLWELIGTPMELVMHLSKQQQRYEVTFDSRDRLQSSRQVK